MVVVLALLSPTPVCVCYAVQHWIIAAVRQLRHHTKTHRWSMFPSTHIKCCLKCSNSSIDWGENKKTKRHFNPSSITGLAWSSFCGSVAVSQNWRSVSVVLRQRQWWQQVFSWCEWFLRCHSSRSRSFFSSIFFSSDSMHVSALASNVAIFCWIIFCQFSPWPSLPNTRLTHDFHL